MKINLFSLKIIIIILIIISNYSCFSFNLNYSNNINIIQKCFKCLNVSKTCETIENDQIVKSNKTLICSDQLGCKSRYSQPSMHPNRTSTCHLQAKYGDQCETARGGDCGFQMICDYPFDITRPPICVGFKALQFGEKCLCDSECDSLICDEKTLVCIENKNSCRVNHYWNGTICLKISDTPFNNNYNNNNCTSNSHCSIFNICNNGTCIEKYSLKEDSYCTSDLSCDISNSLICDEGKCKPFKKSNTTDCQKDGCLFGYEFCNCDSGLCEQSRLFNSECKKLQIQLDACVYGRCVYTGGYISSNSCVMKNCGSLVCQHHTKCTNGPCGNNNSSFCISNTHTPNSNNIATSSGKNPIPNGGSSSSNSSNTIPKISFIFIIFIINFIFLFLI
ncbi:hypothetical protein DDB_G0289757 [Dictyostelium discoideum AX4]|uniref:Dickkopf N-terminal cysteine-rich domain-containing protein n=1 Tax=Dictyostelium discoideum TaxID=44689 RepID=Q54H17_DICDI|nr:hypothetical protein DDB_G0289757 [Dictyostelium discoideum AX4]EAL62590.1 hypothetical protein DDB_G0289757 [Dictyostelium discoideum AX4]|eukprot:XP_636101.1 hypothetical protein DDB_G0289757 [Dictyostelium discoideum AX4]